MNPFNQTTWSLPSLSRFSTIPKEMRLEIWNHMIQPRVVDVEIDERTGLVITRTPTPIVLHICGESREEALRKYKTLFQERTGFTDEKAWGETNERIYFYSAIYTLYIPFPTSPFTNYLKYQVNIPGSPYTVLPDLLGGALSRNSSLVGWCNYGTVYVWKIVSILLRLTNADEIVKSVAIDDPFKGARHTNHAPARIGTYDVDLLFFAIEEIVLYWGDPSVTKQSPRYTDELCSEEVHNRIDDEEIRLTDAYFALSIRHNSNETLKIDLRFQKKPVRNRYRISMNGEDFNVTKPNWLWTWFRL